MKKIYFLLIAFIGVLVCGISSVNAQGVGINPSGTAPDNSAMLDISSTNKGTLITRLTTTQRDSIINPAQSLFIYNTTTKCFEVWENGFWQSVWCAACPTPAQPSAISGTPSGTQIVWNWATVTGATGYKYNTLNDYSSATDNGNNISYTQTGLACNTAYTFYVWAYSGCGNSPVATSTQTSAACSGCTNAWTQLSPTGGPPVARASTTTVWDPIDNIMLVFGGNINGPVVNDLWSYAPSTNTWAQLNPTGTLPDARADHSAVWDAANNRMLVYGGDDDAGNLFSDLWSYTPSSNSWVQLHPSGTPVERNAHTAVWDAANNRMLVFAGGNNVGLLNELWSYTPSSNAWAQLSPSGGPPGARIGHVAVWDAGNNRMLVFGGETFNGVFLNDLWSYSPSSNAWVQLSPGGGPPLQRAYLSAIWNAANSSMLIFGGISFINNSWPMFNDLWSYSSSGNAWTQLNPNGGPPSQRTDNSAIWDAHDSRMLIFGGDDFNYNHLNDVWSYCP